MSLSPIYGRYRSSKSNMNNMVSFNYLKNFVSIYMVVALAAIIGITTVQAELKLVNVLFRHGDRTPDATNDEKYPNDPYLDNPFYPMGRGQLTNNGKMREYVLGQFLRQRYDHFLGDVYRSEAVSAISSDYDRTKMSLQLVLAGLFPPSNLQRWNHDLNWQPIPAKYLRRYEDNLFLPEDCLLFTIEYNRVLQSPAGKQEIGKYSKLMRQLTEWTGKNISTPWDMYYIYHTLMAESSLGLTLPEWSHAIFPNGELLNATIFSYNIANSTPLLKRLYGGPFLRIVTRHMLNHVTGAQNRERKINLFSGHESNVAAVLHALGVFYPHVPEYSSSVILELHQNNNAYYVKVLNYLGIPSEAKELQLPGCEILCPLDKYLQLIEGVMPSNDELICDKGLSQAFVDRKSIEELSLLKYNLIRTAGIIESK
ncbi:venom acid phosphatase Acph-1-like isoform X1 [Bombus vosnesenskii]|uniref:acid phosphatase n=4 Tax=Pyrobombus TaxID=144703 RepID=A0A6J3KME8_9HYME|nr:venom acid phosphatase Acph-1-like isoform X1 [Bombus vancouverensis nearcticus]XP_033302567.1 venom acid phosphatase Acph-1-like isoform X1 [Bombus bifarius]XP_033354388.1 venom acid phosphatase Acph-1-like isoform X1 [Bombus vosnesenskii]XP_050472729.1 venom acid phosphatase Acph-1-like isoform X1 [Bombus huntii]